MRKSIWTAELRVLTGILREAREDLGLTQAELAMRLGETQPFISVSENGQRRLDYLELREICRALGLSLEEFARRFEERVLSRG